VFTLVPPADAIASRVVAWELAQLLSASTETVKLCKVVKDATEQSWVSSCRGGHYPQLLLKMGNFESEFRMLARRQPQRQCKWERPRHWLDMHDLRAAGSLQLAAALTWCQQRPARRRFICAESKVFQCRRGGRVFCPELSPTH